MLYNILDVLPDDNLCDIISYLSLKEIVKFSKVNFQIEKSAQLFAKTIFETYYINSYKELSRQNINKNKKIKWLTILSKKSNQKVQDVRRFQDSTCQDQSMGKVSTCKSFPNCSCCKFYEKQFPWPNPYILPKKPLTCV